MPSFWLSVLLLAASGSTANAFDLGDVLGQVINSFIAPQQASSPSPTASATPTAPSTPTVLPTATRPPSATQTPVPTSTLPPPTWTPTRPATPVATLTATPSTTPTATAAPTLASTPSPPSGLVATAVSCSQVDLRWNASSNAGSRVKGYDVFRNGSLIAQLTNTSTSDRGLAASTIYSYQVSVVDDAGNQSAKSASASVSTPACAAGSGDYRWSRNIGGAGPGDNALATGVAATPLGEAVVVGRFSGTVDFGGGPLASVGSDDVFVARYTANGGYAWAKRFGGPSIDVAAGVAVDGAGDVILAGTTFSAAADFGGGPLSGPGDYDVIVAKYSSSGEHRWSKRVGGPLTDRASAVAVDENGNVLVTGSFYGTADFGAGPLTSAGGSDVFVVKYSPDGDPIWSKRFGGTSTDAPKAIASDGEGNVLVAGLFRGTIDFGQGPMTSAGDADVFMAKYSADGDILWAKRFGGSGADSANGIAVDPAGDVILAGDFVGTVDFGAGPLTDDGGGGIFLAKYSSDGDALWSEHFGTGFQYGEHANAVTTDGYGDVVLTGSIADAVDFGGGPLTADQYSYDAFVAKLAGSDGSHVWSKRAGGAFDDHGTAIATDGAGDVLAAGDFHDQADFGGSTLTSPGGTNAYLVDFSR